MFTRREVALFVSLDFLEPILSIAGRHSAVFRAAMPEAAVDKNGDALFCEHEIGSAWDGAVTAPAFDAGGAEELR